MTNGITITLLNTVAIAAPKTPKSNAKIKIGSKIIFKTAAITFIITAVLLSPPAWRIV